VRQYVIFIDFKKACDSVRMVVLHSIVIEFGILMRLVRILKICSDESYSEVCINKHLSDAFLIQNGLKQGDSLLPLLFSFALE
jgi:hypothetical protein